MGLRKLANDDLKNFLDEKVARYNSTFFIEKDPISIPHRFSKKQDIEIAGFLSATIAWGQRLVILRNAAELLRRMDNDPYRFILGYTPKDLQAFGNFIHRTFNGIDCMYFLQALRSIYREHESLENFLTSVTNPDADVKGIIIAWRNAFFGKKHQPRTQKHFADPEKGSAAKRINMFLRWMIRKDMSGVDFGLWDLPPSLLVCPLDVHSGRVARKLGLLTRKQDDWDSAIELTTRLRRFDPKDPVKYDFALFGLGAYESF